MKQRAQMILALDVDDIQQAKYFVNRLYPKIRTFKVGPVLFTAYGPRIIDCIRKKGAQVFLDLKFHDIPNTVAGAVRQAVRLKVKMLTLHIAGGSSMLEAAVKAAEEESKRLNITAPLLIGVTVLTSQGATPAQVLGLAKEAKAAGLDGVVCSVREAKALRKMAGAGFVIVTPGIRPHAHGFDDQRRVATVSDAVKAGSDFLVVGRPILEAKDPLAAMQAMLQELRAPSSSRK